MPHSTSLWQAGNTARPLARYAGREAEAPQPRRRTSAAHVAARAAVTATVNEPATWAAFVRLHRTRSGFSQGELGHKIGKDRTTVSRWERGLQFPDGGPTDPVVADVCGVLGVPLAAAWAALGYDAPETTSFRRRPDHPVLARFVDLYYADDTSDEAREKILDIIRAATSLLEARDARVPTPRRRSA